MRYQALIVTDWTLLLGEANSGGQSSWESQPTCQHHRMVATQLVARRMAFVLFAATQDRLTQLEPQK